MPNFTSRLLTSLTATALLLTPIGAAASVPVPEQVPDRGPVASEPMQRGDLVRSVEVILDTGDTSAPVRVIDGDGGDWVGESSRIGGTQRYSRGEHIYADFIHDAWGADDGDDRDRLLVTGTVAGAEARTTRADQMFQALGAQFGAPDPVGADEAYGDALANDVADIVEVRWAAGPDDTLDLLVPVSNLTDAGALGVLLLADTDTGQPFGTVDLAGLETQADTAVLLTADGVHEISPATGELTPVEDAQVVVDAEGWTNTLEARLPRALVAGSDDGLRVSVISGRWDGAALTPANLAYRAGEPVAGMYNDQDQALTLLDGVITETHQSEIDLARLRDGFSEHVVPGPGYHERTFQSAEGISAELREGLDDIYEDTVWQRYALFVPSDHDPVEASPLTFWLHYRGGKAHSGGAWSPRLFTQLGEEAGSIVVTPHGRGERRWYEGSSHQDFWEVYADVHEVLRIDPARRHLSGYSMGGHGTPMMALLHPDLFASAYLQAGAIGGNLLDIAVNARNTPFWFDVSSGDALVAVNQQMAMDLRDLGYRYVANTFTVGEHYTQAILDEWAGGARYLHQQATDPNPRHVTYRVVPSLIDTINDGRGEPTSVRFAPDGAWWVDDIVVAEGAEHGTVDAVARTLPGSAQAPAIDLGGILPGDYSVPSVPHGQTWTAAEAAIAPQVDVDLVGVASVTLDAGRWDLQEPTTLVVTSDGPATVTLTGLGADRVIEVAAGSTAVLLAQPTTG